MELGNVFKSKRNILIISGATIALIILIVYFVYISSLTPQIEIPALPTQVETDSKLTAEQQKEMEDALSQIEKGLNKSNKFNNLILQGKIPVEIGSIGKDNPFAEF